jgi:hypothetical protein
VSQNISDYLMDHRAWRLLAVSGALPALINFFILIFVPESHKWEEERSAGNTSHWATKDLLTLLVAGVVVLGIIYAWSPLAHFGNAVAFPITIVGLIVALWGYLHPVRQYLARSLASGNVSAEMRSRVMKNLLLGATLAAIALLGTWGSTQQTVKWSASLLPKDSKFPILDYTQMLTAVGAIFISLITPVIADKAGRRITYFILCLASLAIAIAFFQTNHLFISGKPDMWFFVSAFLIGGITASFYGFFPLYFPELFPTSVRATGQGFCFNFGRVIAAVGSLQLANLKSIFSTDANAYCVLCSIYLLGLIVIWFCPETKGKALE